MHSFIAPASVVLLALLVTGCGYVHFGRLQPTETESAALKENAELRLEKKLLQQELAITGKELRALRSSLEERQAAPSRTEPAGSQMASAMELASLRASINQLNKELLQQKEARSRAEKRVTELEKQLSEQANRPAPAARTTPLSSLRESTASSASEINLHQFSRTGGMPTEAGSTPVPPPNKTDAASEVRKGAKSNASDKASPASKPRS